MTDAESKWRERVQAWRASGKSAAIFAAEHGYSESTLKWWACRLVQPAGGSPKRVRARKDAPQVAFVRVERTTPAVSGEVVIKIGTASVVVTRGSNEEALRLALRVLGGGA